MPWDNEREKVSRSCSNNRNDYIRLYKLERIFSQQVDLKSALDSK